jgi:imidazolonepropionase-like amidohydrolase
VVDVTGKFLVPAFIDSHVHLAYYEVATGLSRAGVAAALDLAAPLAKLSLVREPLSVINSGPMLTAKGGYPTTSWGRDGYGLEISSETEARDAVNTLLGAGAKVIKVAITQEPSLDRATLAAAVDAAHAHQLKVFAHALNESEAERAALANVDALAHTPTQLLSAKSLEYWGARSVVSTLSAFGGGTSAVQNLRALRAAGARVLYGTDLGNTRSAGIQSEELELLRTAGLDGAAIVAAGTQVPAEYLGFAELGALTPDKRASFMILDQDPTLDPQTLTRPNAVYINGKRVD